jgi:aspartate/tyrosine/aromatic aminotransferase
MSARIQGVRAALFQELCRLQPQRDWRFLAEQIGMFSFTGLSPPQVARMVAKHSVFMTHDGRISLAGLSSTKVGYVAAAMDEVLRSGV